MYPETRPVSKLPNLQSCKAQQNSIAIAINVTHPIVTNIWLNQNKRIHEKRQEDLGDLK